jgi:arylsulfatase
MGRVLNTIEGMGELDNTLVIYIQGDNGASAEGTPQGLLTRCLSSTTSPKTSSK